MSESPQTTDSSDDCGQYTAQNQSPATTDSDLYTDECISVYDDEPQTNVHPLAKGNISPLTSDSSELEANSNG